MQIQQSICIFWFRRDLRLHDNAARTHALQAPYPLLPVLIFDTSIHEKPGNRQDTRITFVNKEPGKPLYQFLRAGSSLLVQHKKLLDIYKKLCNEFKTGVVYIHCDQESSAKKQNYEAGQCFAFQYFRFWSYKDQQIFEWPEILSCPGTPCWVPESLSGAYPRPTAGLRKSRTRAFAPYKKYLDA